MSVSGENGLSSLSGTIAFADPQAARRALSRIAAVPLLEPLLPHLLASLSDAADPDQVVVNFERFLCGMDSRTLPPALPVHHPRAVEMLVSLFAGSQFLTEILLRNPEYLDMLLERKSLSRFKSATQFQTEAMAALSHLSGDGDVFTDRLDVLRRFQRRELLRIGTCDLLGLLDLPSVAMQLSYLADALVCVSLAVAAASMNLETDGFAVVALGKLGGQELNYSSDIDLLFLAASYSEGYRRLGERLIEVLARVTGEGFLYRVDMRLRPWGQTGALVSSLDGYAAYLESYAHLWEKQALLKARYVAGDRMVGEEFLHRVERILFDQTCSATAAAVRSSVQSMKERTEAHLREKGREWGEIKLGEGSIRDVEFVVQYLQLIHGAEHPAVRCPNTLEALRRLAGLGLITAEEWRILTEGYIFLRTIEHYLQIAHYRQTHRLPDEPASLAHLARRLGFHGRVSGTSAVAEFLARYEEHRAAIRAVYLRYLGEQGRRAVNVNTHPVQAKNITSVSSHVARMDPSYVEAFDEEEIARHATLAAQLDEEHLVWVEACPLGEEGYWRVTIVGYDYPGELSLICGLLFVYGFTICDGKVFTYEPSTGEAEREARRKIVDVFTVRQVRGEMEEETWSRYTGELSDLLRMMDAGLRREARGKLARRVAAAFHKVHETAPVLYPVDIRIDNSTSAKYTVLHIDAPDTVGFLYELTNALAYHRIYIARVTVETVGNRVRDTLYVTDAEGQKITSPEKQRELRAAVVLIKHFTHLLPHSPNPEAALLHFREFIGELFRRPNWPDELASLGRQDVLYALARLLGVSDFLWDDFLRMQYANLFPVVRDLDALESAKSRAQLQAELEAALAQVHAGPQPPSDTAPWRAVVNDFKDREMFRIDMRHILGHTQEFWDFAEELTALAEVVVNAVYHLCHEDLRAVYGTPCLEDGQISEMAVCALGKCGGRELGFASDIELMFIYAGNGRTTGPHVITTAEFYEKLVQHFISSIRARREGIFEIDLRLRPYGSAGSLAVSLESFRRYFAPEGPAWPYERQALVKLRPIAGNEGLGQYIVELRDRFVYTGEPFNVQAMRAMRERQLRHLVAAGTFNAKFSPGGLLDVEYLVQALQITHGHRDPALRSTNTREAMAALAQAGILSPDDYARLRRAHTFLRWLIDGLRMVRGNAQDLTVPPPDSEEFAFLARRLRYGNDVARLYEDLERHTAHVRELNARLL
ncbi:MAG: glutamine synthetase adenylyltransferase [Anaerolineae bacterium]|nr:glutamine synthetase adenylyltransferase [Anaerolineae bacterium]